MNILEIIYTILIMPLQLFFEEVFSFAQRFTDDPGLSIIVLSLTVNFLVLPLYKRADAIQAEQRDIEKKLAPEVKHIKKVFSGDEKMMMLQTYYRHNDYRPADVFKESISLLLQIPFFIAAYRFLSNLALLDGAMLGPIKDLGQPDGLISLGAVTLNLLPILMTAINVISVIIYTKGFPIKTKIQLYGMAAIFLILLYQSPSGLVFYWTLNNLFSLVKNVFFKLKNPQKVLTILSSIAGIILVIYSIFFFKNTLKRRAIAVGIGLLLQLPLIISVLKRTIKTEKLPKIKYPEPSPKLFLLSGILLTILIGGLIPSAVIKASPQEFINTAAYQDPLWNVVYAVCLAFGTFVVWMGVFYRIAEKNGKSIIENLLWAFCGVAIVDYMFFGTDLGIMFATLQYEKMPSFLIWELIVNVMTVLIVVVTMLIVYNIYNEVFNSGILTVGIIVIMIMTMINMVSIEMGIKPVIHMLKTGKEISEDTGKHNTDIHFNLSKTGRNVVIIMLDKAIGPFIPYIMNEKPELEELFDGFTYYSNCISFGRTTNFGTPAIYGGYEYSPVEMNKRDKESLKDKQNEALKVLPVLFSSNGFDVTVFDPTYANYCVIPDVTIYGDYPGIRAYNTDGMFNRALNTDNQNKIRRNFFLYGIMKSIPLFMQKYVYGAGSYNGMPHKGDTPIVQTTESPSKATGQRQDFIDAYTVLENMDSLTEVNEDSPGGFLMMSNNTTHSPMLLQEPEYVPQAEVNNESYDMSHMDRFTVNGRRMIMETAEHYAYYETDMATMLQLGKWFEYLKGNDIYDNTRIILVSDHGGGLSQFDELMLDIDDMERYANLLMVKDYDGHGFNTSDEFMTIGDVATIAVSEVINNPINPFTGKEINSGEKYEHDQYITMSPIPDIQKDNGNQFLSSDWLAVHDDLWDKNNWRIIAKDSVFTGE